MVRQQLFDQDAMPPSDDPMGVADAVKEPRIKRADNVVPFKNIIREPRGGVVPQEHQPQHVAETVQSPSRLKVVAEKAGAGALLLAAIYGVSYLFVDALEHHAQEQIEQNQQWAEDSERARQEAELLGP